MITEKTKRAIQAVLSLVFLISMAVPLAKAANWDETGDSLLNGTFNFREILWIPDQNASNTLDEALAQYGTITFDGQGNYTINGTSWSSVSGSASLSISGRYAISSSGYGFIRRPRVNGADVYGSVSNGVFLGSSTESGTDTLPGFNTVFIAAKQPTTPVTTFSFNQPYAMVYTNLTSPSLTGILDAAFTINPTGNASLGTVQATGYVGGTLTAVSQSITGASYTFTNGVGTLNFGSQPNSALISGNKQLFVSPNGEFVFGGSTNGWDMLIGVRRSSATPAGAFNKLYYQAGLDVERSNLPSGTAELDSYFGSFNVVSSVNTILYHQRLLVAPDNPFDYTYSDNYSSSNDTHDDFLGLHYFVSDNGNFQAGYGKAGYLGINAAVKAPALSGSGVFLDPTGVVNAASFAPFTTAIAPGEVIALFGTNLSTGSATDGTFPQTLAKTSVQINGRVAPIYVATPTFLSVLVPFETEIGVPAEIIVTNNGVVSNRVTVQVNQTAPGVFSQTVNGLGLAAAQHTDYSLLTEQNPAQAGQYLFVYLTGLGTTNPAIATGAAAPSNQLVYASAPIRASLNGQNLNFNFAGLTPTARGLYQINIQMPNQVASGDLYLDIEGPDTVSSQIQIPVSGTRAASATGRPAPHRGAPPQSPLSTRRSTGSDSSASSPSRSR